MPTTIYDSSQLTKRRAEKAIAGSFLTRLYPPNLSQPQTGYGPLPGIYDSSIMNAVKTGHMTEYTRYNACVSISPGCPCPELNASLSSHPFVPAIPGAVSGITFTVGSIVLTWNAPTTSDGPFTYIVTPYLNGLVQTPVTTNDTTYRFTELEEWQPYTFTVCAMNAGGQGPVVPSTTYFLAPPNSLSTIMNGGSTANIVPSLKYVINAALDTMLQYSATKNLGPTRGSRLMYVWIASITQAWNWISASGDSRISGTHDTWNWNTRATTPLSDTDSIIWLCTVIDYITPYFVGDTYKSIYNCPASIITRVKAAGEWTTWVNIWKAWYNYRVGDGNVAAAATQPDIIQNVNLNNPLIVDGTTVNNINGFPAPQKWSALWLKGTGAASPQKYMTYTWDSVLSTCLSEVEEQTIQLTHQPLTGLPRDAEVDAVKDITASLTDAEKCCAEFWAGGPGTVSPPLMFIWFWKEYMRSTNPKMTDKQNIMYSLLDLSIHLFEGGRVTWRLKSAYMEDRPIQEIRRRYAGQTIQSWNGSVDGAQWMPYQEANFVTPPFADFPSGHSHFSTAFALTMNKWFDSVITQTQMYYDKQTLICPLFTSNSTQAFGTFTIAKGKSEIEPGICPAAPVIFNYGTWNEMSDGVLGAGISRLYGGIHCTTANTSSQSIAGELNTLINAAWNIQTV